MGIKLLVTLLSHVRTDLLQHHLIRERRRRRAAAEEPHKTQIDDDQRSRQIDIVRIDVLSWERDLRRRQNV